jgi:hypothetical protein
MSYDFVPYLVLLLMTFVAGFVTATALNTKYSDPMDRDCHFRHRGVARDDDEWNFDLFR